MKQMEHFSYSQLSMFLRCPEQYRRRYPEGERIPPGVAVIRGTACHEARTVNMKQKVKSGEDLPMDDVLDAAADSVEQSFAGEVLLNEEEQHWGLKVVKAETKDVAVSLAKLDRQVLHPHIHPVFVPTGPKFEGDGKLAIVHDELPKPIIMYLDLVDQVSPGLHVIRDLKTKSRAPQENEAERSSQLTLYHLGWQVRSGGVGLPEIRVALDCLVAKKKPEAVVLEATRTVDDHLAVLRRMAVVMQAIEHGDFPPCDEGSWACDPKWCGYYSTCPYVAHVIRRAA